MGGGVVLLLLCVCGGAAGIKEYERFSIGQWETGLFASKVNHTHNSVVVEIVFPSRSGRVVGRWGLKIIIKLFCCHGN